MPRHPALIPLSHDHHHTLVLALRLKKGGPSSPNDNWPTDLNQQIQATLDFAARELAPHFKQEEEVLFPLLLKSSAAALVSELLVEHREMERLLEKLRNSDDPRSPMIKLGQLIEQHIRKEERQLFANIESLLTAEQLDSLSLHGSKGLQ